MGKTLLTVLFFSWLFATGQPDRRPISHPTGEAPVFSTPKKALVDSCGAYFNNYVAIGKTSNLFFEAMREGNNNPGSTGYLSGRGQRFHAPQPIEVSGIEFFGFQTSTTLDSIMVITLLYDYDQDKDSVGSELARDTVYVKEKTFSAVLPTRAVRGYFDPVTVTEDYVVAIITETDDSLKIYTNDAGGGDGADERVAFGYYDNPFFSSFKGWYEVRTEYGATYDVDYLIAPMVKFDLHDNFSVTNDSVCPNITSAACVQYDQLPVYGDNHYNRKPANQHVQWLWGDGLQNTKITNACHTYINAGTYDVSLNDSIHRYMTSVPYCSSSVTQKIHVLDSAEADFSTSHAGLTVSFLSNVNTPHDSLAWDFGDGAVGGNETGPTHKYTAVGSYDAWQYVYGPCNKDSVMITVVVNDLSTENNNQTNLRIYPNPAKNTFSITGDTKDAELHIFNVLGEEILNEKLIKAGESYNCSNWPKGVYLVQFLNTSGEYTKKLLVE